MTSEEAIIVPRDGLFTIPSNVFPFPDFLEVSFLGGTYWRVF